MSTHRNSPVPVFTPWDGKAMTIRHHEHGERVGRISYGVAPDDPTAARIWMLAWHLDHLLATTHETGPLAVAAARDAYPEYLAAEARSHQEEEDQHAYRERFLKRQAGAVARALRIPTGGQKGWRDRPKPPA